MRNELLVVLPAYNEEGNVNRLVNRWLLLKESIQKEFGLSLCITIVDDGSSDRTAEYGLALEKEYEEVRLIRHTCNKGLGEAIKTGIAYGIEDRENCKYLCIMDCDNTQDPKYIQNMLRKMEIPNAEGEKDVVIASRYEKGASVHGLSARRALISYGARGAFQLLLPVKNVRDYTCGYRLYRMNVLRKARKVYGDNLIEETGFTCMVELLYKLACIGARFSEIPFELHYEEKVGLSKMKVLKTATRSIALGIQLRKYKSRRNQYRMER